MDSNLAENPIINHHIKPFRNRKLGRFESFDLKMYKYIRLEYVLNMLETRKFRFDSIRKWEDVYENFVDKEEVKVLNSKHGDINCGELYGQSWTVQEESDAMWRIYSDRGSAVRVMTMYPLLNKMFYEWNSKQTNHIWPIIDYVSYADEKEINKWLLSNTPMNFWALIELKNEGIFIKRREFEHEKEVRVMIRDYNKDVKDFIELDFDPNRVFCEIVIDPRVSEEEFNRQRDSLVNRGFDISKIRKSTLYDFNKVSLVVDMKEPCDVPIIEYIDGKPVQKYVPISWK